MIAELWLAFAHSMSGSDRKSKRDADEVNLGNTGL